MPRGGRRVGAGRKKHSGIILGMDGSRREVAPESLAPVTPEVRDSLLVPPGSLPADVQACWRELAPLALAVDVRTLHPSTESGFRELCGLLAIVRALDAKIAHLGAASQEALSYLNVRKGQVGQLTAALKDFKLTALGKPVTADKPKTANPWGAFGSAAK